MNRKIETIRVIETTRWRFEIHALEPSLSLETNFEGTEIGAEDVRRDVEAGRLVHFDARSVLIHKPTGETVAEDNLCGCVYESFRDFIECRGYAHDMIRTLIPKGREFLTDLRLRRLRSRLERLEKRKDEIANKCANFTNAAILHGERASPHHMDRTYGEARDYFAYQWGRLLDLTCDVRGMIQQIELQGEIYAPERIDKAGGDPDPDLIFEEGERTDVPARS
jgi:hypothetical protein